MENMKVFFDEGRSKWN